MSLFHQLLQNGNGLIPKAHNKMTLISTELSLGAMMHSEKN